MSQETHHIVSGLIIGIHENAYCIIRRILIFFELFKNSIEVYFLSLLSFKKE